LLLFLGYDVGIYSFFTISSFNILFISFIRYKGYYYKEKDIIPGDGCVSGSIPFVSVIVPVKARKEI
jgi:hypothetical protein